MEKRLSGNPGALFLIFGLNLRDGVHAQLNTGNSNFLSGKECEISRNKKYSGIIFPGC
jgi:hypothetical protein